MSDIHIYIIGSSADAEVCKIGIAIEPKKRLAQLQTGSHSRLLIAATFPCPNRDIARYRESAAHKLFAEYRLSGEWFGVSPDTVIAKASDWFVVSAPKAKKQQAPKSLMRSDFQPFHPKIPNDLFGVPIFQMEYEDRVRFWEACGLEPPPEGFDDWYLIGSEKNGVMRAIPVEGFVCQEPSSE